MIISDEEFDKLRFGQQIGLPAVPVQVQGALLLGFAEKLFPNTRDLHGKLFLFRHLWAEVRPCDPTNLRSIEEGTILVDFGNYQLHNEKIVRSVMKITFPKEMSELEVESLYRKVFYRYTAGRLIVTKERDRAHIEKLL